MVYFLKQNKFIYLLSACKSFFTESTARLPSHGWKASQCVQLLLAHMYPVPIWLAAIWPIAVRLIMRRGRVDLRHPETRP